MELPSVAELKLNLDSPLEPRGESVYSASDFYWEDGCVVFTAAYHLRRGYCCDSGCRHCPYSSDKQQKDDCPCE